MIGDNSTKMRITINNNIKTSNDKEFRNENSLTQNLKRYKSQDTYICLFNKFSTEKKKDNERSNNSHKLNENMAINANAVSKILPIQINSQINQLQLSMSAEKFSKCPDSSSGFINNKTRVENVPPIVNKIISDESIHELNTEENVDSIDEEDYRQLDEMKSSELITDFYTNSISEANSICKKQNKLINALPQPFVKQIKNKFMNFSGKEKSLSKEKKKNSKEIKIQLSTKVPEKSDIQIDFTNVLNKFLSNNIIDNDESQISVDSTSKKVIPDKVTPPSNKINFIKMNSEGAAYPKFKTEEEKRKIELDSAYRKFVLSAKKGDREGFLENLEILNQLNGDINYKDESGWTGLHYASDEGNLKIVDILINTLADVNCKTNNKKTPLHLATSHGYFDISKLLVENGCIINSLDDEKNTPIHICASIGHLELLKLLLDRFPQADAKNIYGKSPMDLAKKDEIKLILQEYLKKNESIYHRVPILNADKKAVKILFKNINTNPNFTSQTENFNNFKTKDNHQINSNSNEKNIPQINHLENNKITQNIANNMKPHHNKFQSIDFDKNVNQLKTINQLGNAFPNNNINININTNINNPKGPVNVLNLQTPIKETTSKQINQNEKVKVNVETKVKNEKLLNKNNFAKDTTTSTKFLTLKTNQNKIPKEKRNSSKIPKKHSTIAKTKNLKNNSNNNTNQIDNINNTANFISNNEISYSTNNQTNDNLNNTTTPHINKRNSSNSKINIGSKKNNSNTTRNLISLANKVEINLAAHTTPDKKLSKNSKLNVNNTTINKKIINKSNNDLEKSDNEQSTKKDTNRTYDVNHSCNLINITDLSNKKQNILKTRDEESTINKIEENVLNEENSLCNNNSQNDIDNNYQENQSSCVMSMDEGNKYLQNMNSFSVEEEKTGASEFICLALLGKGSFGEVYLVEKKNTNMIYAMKVLSKDKIMGQNLVKYAMTERNVLSVTNHPFIVKLNYSFQTSDKLFLILDYCPGGDLALHLERENRFSEQRAKIYICEIILALEDLHKRDIIFRDLKPDNVVLDREGHALLTDFGLSKEGVFDSKSAKSFCGSIAYLAPEMLKRSGHGKAVDWYLLGVLFYEMLVGIPPYFTNNKDQLFKNIERAELQIPKFVSEKAADLLRALLQRNPLLRLGSGIADAEEIKHHDYFKDVNWEDVYNRKLIPPIPLVYNQILQKFSEPRVFNDATYNCGLYPNYDMISHFNGWSFVNNNTSNNQTINTSTKCNK